MMVGKRISDRRLLKLIGQFLRAGVLEEGMVRTPTAGTPQGGVLRPLLANIYLNYLDKVWTGRCRQLGELVRYADDFVILCRTEVAAQEALRRLGVIVARLGLRLHPTKTQVVDLTEGRAGFDFLGFHCRRVLSWRYGRRYLQRWPRQKAMAAIRGKIRDIVGSRRHLSRSLSEVIRALNPVLRGWGTYFRVGNSTRHFCTVDSYVKERLALYLSKKHGRSGRGWAQRWHGIDLHAEGLYQLSGTVCWHRAYVHAGG